MTTDDIIQSKAKTIVNDLSTAIDIAIIIEIILTIVKLLASKHKSEAETLVIMHNPGIMQKWELRLIVRKHLGINYSYNDINQVTEGLYKAGKGTSLNEVTKLYEYYQPNG